MAMQSPSALKDDEAKIVCGVLWTSQVTLGLGVGEFVEGNQLEFLMVSLRGSPNALHPLARPTFAELA